jgi:hypothetical protein
MNEIESGKDFILSTAEDLRKIKDDIIQLTILRIINSLKLSKCTVEGISNELSERYKFSIDIIVLKDLMEGLKKEKYIESEVGEDAKLCYKVKDAAIELLDSVAGHKQQIIDECFEGIINKIPDYKDFAGEYKDQIATDFLFAFAEEMDKFYYDIVDEKSTVCKEYNAKLKCNVTDISDELLKEKLSEAYTALPKEQPELFDKLLNITFFWNSFLRLYSLKPEDRKLFLEGVREIQIFADTNTIISYICHQDWDHNRIILSYNFLKDQLGMEILYSEETKKELEKIMHISSDVVKCLQYYPERASNIAKKADHPVVKGFFYENYINWDSYEELFWNELNDFFKLFADEKKIYVQAKNEMENILEDVERIMHRRGARAKHDAYLIALVRLLRKVRSEDMSGDWFRCFKYIDWISTPDFMFRKYDNSVSEKSDPVSLLVYYLPFYFHPYFIAKAIEEDFKIEDCYDLLYITSFLLVDDDKAEERRRTLEGTSRPIASVKNRDQFTEILLKFTKVNLAKMDLEEGLKDDNA